MFRKITISRSSTADNLLELCKKELKCAECAIEAGPTEEIIYKTSPPPNTLGIIVDITSAGAMKVGESSNNALGVASVGMVGKEDAANLVLVPWDVRWWFYTIGAVGIRYVVRT